jgi:hypothetical protein
MTDITLSPAAQSVVAEAQTSNLKEILSLLDKLKELYGQSGKNVKSINTIETIQIIVIHRLLEERLNAAANGGIISQEIADQTKDEIDKAWLDSDFWQQTL